MIQKSAEANSDLIRNKIQDQISKNSSQKNSEAVTNVEEIVVYLQKKGSKLLMI